MRVIQLMPGMVFESHTYICQQPHPLYPGLQLVVWILDNGIASFDALSPHHELGTPDLGPLGVIDDELRKNNIRKAFQRHRGPTGPSPLTAPITHGVRIV
jgi:hypothetical protein